MRSGPWLFVPELPFAFVLGTRAPLEVVAAASRLAEPIAPWVAEGGAP